MSAKSYPFVAPSTSETAFNCLHCRALARQNWFSVRGSELHKDQVPKRFDDGDLDNILKGCEDTDEKIEVANLFHKIRSGSIFLERENHYTHFKFYNLAISSCFNCEKLTVWINHRVAWPSVGLAPAPNSDLSDDIQNDYREASAIFEQSPRGAAALLRLCIQKICRVLGEKGKNIDSDIAELVKKGLDIRVQKALDIVRVVGNNAVHPGSLDLKDDRETAQNLFGLVNLIADIMISQPKHLSNMFDNLPPNAIAAIESRDGAS